MSERQDTNETVFDEGSDRTVSGPVKKLRSPASVYKPTLVCLEGPHRGMRFALQGAEMIVGRGSQADIRLEDEMISRRHLAVRWVNWDQPTQLPQCFCEDLGSRNGTELNGVPLQGAVPLRERDRLFLGTTVLGFFLRDAEEIELDRTLYELATKDALTGLDNRHHFMALFTHHLERVRRHGHPMALLIIDADHFKQVNDRYGHDVGDLALKHIARLLKLSCRSTDVCARWGGEEFTVLAMDSAHDGAIVVAERIRDQIQQTPLVTPLNESLHLTVSVGGTLLRPDDCLEEALRRADASLYHAKELGRNRTVFDGHPIGPDHTATFTVRPPLPPLE